MMCLCIFLSALLLKNAYSHMCKFFYLSPGRGIGSVGNAWLAEYSEAGVVRFFELSPAVERQTHSCPYSLEP